MSSMGERTLKDQVKDHWEAETCGVRHSEADVRRFADIEQARYQLVPWLRDFVDFNQCSGKELLEVGVGAGTDFCQWVRGGAIATGIDLTEAAIKATRDNLRSRGLSAKDLRVADAEQLPFDDGLFDVVYSWGVIHHSPDTQRALNEIARVLKPGGRVIAMIYHTPSISDLILWVRHGLFRGRPFRSFKDIVFHELESPGTKAYTRREAHCLIADAGLRDPNIQTHVGQSDTLEMKLSSKYDKWIYKALQAIYPSWLFKNSLGNLLGRCLIFTATK